MCDTGLMLHVESLYHHYRILLRYSFLHNLFKPVQVQCPVSIALPSSAGRYLQIKASTVTPVKNTGMVKLPFVCFALMSCNNSYGV